MILELMFIILFDSSNVDTIKVKNTIDEIQIQQENVLAKLDSLEAILNKKIKNRKNKK